MVCAQEGALLPLTECYAAKLVSYPAAPAVLQPMRSHVTAPTAGYKEPPDKGYFNGKADPVQLVSAPVLVFACATLEDCPREARGAQGTAPASSVVLQEMNLPVCYPPQFYLGRAWLPAES